MLLLLLPYLYCLFAMARLYLFWQFNPSFFSYVSPATVPDAFPERQPPVPKIIHQTWKNKEVPEKWRAAQQSCIDMHPGYKYMLWTDEDALALVRDKYPWFLATYSSYPYNIQRADALRYFVLHEHGGIYLDLDIVCIKSLDFVRHYNFTAPKTYPIGVSNDFLASAPGTAFAHHLITHLATWNHWFVVKYATVMFSTGPMFVTAQFTLFGDRDEMVILPADLYGKYAVSNGTVFKHLHGSSWHGEDAKLVFWLEHHGLLAASFAALLLITGALCYWFYGGNRTLPPFSSQAGPARGAQPGTNKGW